MKGEHAAAKTADLIKKLRDWVREDMDRADLTASEVIETLDLAWCAAERWRIEHFGLLDDGESPGDPVSPAFNA